MAVNKSAFEEDGDPCPSCREADLEFRGNKFVCPACGMIIPCCQPLG
jgi:predicted RNA-binding Zn-ribbon protein involved in translation (DUF1610 family)